MIRGLLVLMFDHKIMLILEKQWPFPSLFHLLHQSWCCQLQKIIFPLWSPFFSCFTLGKTLVKSVKVSMSTGSQIPSLLSNSVNWVNLFWFFFCECCHFVVLFLWLTSYSLNLLSAFIRAGHKLKLYRRNPLSVVIWILSVLIVPSFKSLMIFFWCCQTIMFGFYFKRNCRALLYKSLLMLNSCNVVFPRNLLHSITYKLSPSSLCSRTTHYRWYVSE